MNVVISPVSNDFLRDWPIENYGNLVDLLVQRTEAKIYLVGSPGQRACINEIVRCFDPSRVLNMAGRTSWTETQAFLKTANVVVANNSGLAHLSAKFLTPVVCLFCTSHDPFEWMPRGPHVTVLYSQPPCAPCCHHGYGGCPVGKRCLRSITPEIVLTETLALAATPRPLSVSSDARG
jgi:heptosyltransferase-2